MKNEVSVAVVMEQLEAVGADQNAQRTVLRKCPEEFLKEMAEVVRMEPSCSFWRMPMKEKKKYYLDMLTQVYANELPTEVLKRDKEVRLDWLIERPVATKYAAQWYEYLR